MKRLIILTTLAVFMSLSLTSCQDEPTTPEGNRQVTATPTAEPTPTPTPIPIVDDVLPEVVEDTHPLAGMNRALERFPQVFDTGLPHVEGTVFRYALGSASPWAGLFGASVFWDAGDDNVIASLLGTSLTLFSTTPMLQWGQDGIVNWAADTETQTITLNMQEDVFWHDGHPLTLDDLVFAFETMAHPDGPSVRFGTIEQRIVGIQDFRNGYAPYISGLVLSNDNRTLEIHLEIFPPTIPYFALWSSPMPRHIFGDMAVADIPNSTEFRVNPVGWGPFMVSHIVAGESIRMVRNVNYVWGAPYIEELILDRVHPDLIPSMMAAGVYDFAVFPTAHFEDHQHATNIRFLGSPTGGYSFMSFRLGHWDDEYNINVFDEHRPMNNVDLRRAMAFAVDYQLLGDTLYAGLQFPAGSFMSPLHHAFMDFDVPMFRYDPEYANQILDDAGFTRGSDGFRTWPNGNPLEIVWAFITGRPHEETLINFHMQSFEAIGLRVVLWQGRAHDRLALWDILDVDDDNEEIHIYDWAWTAGFNPNPAGRWGNAFWNPSRYNSEEWERLLARLDSQAAWDPDYLMQAYSDMQWHLYNVVAFYPTLWSINLTALNDRVANWDTRIGANRYPSNWHLIRLTASSPMIG